MLAIYSICTVNRKLEQGKWIPVTSKGEMILPFRLSDLSWPMRGKILPVQRRSYIMNLGFIDVYDERVHTISHKLVIT
jgi:hypothetical protein